MLLLWSIHLYLYNHSDLHHPDGEPQGEGQGGHDQDQGADGEQVGTQTR